MGPAVPACTYPQDQKNNNSDFGGRTLTAARRDENMFVIPPGRKHRSLHIYYVFFLFSVCICFLLRWKRYTFFGCFTLFICCVRGGQTTNDAKRKGIYIYIYTSYLVLSAFVER